MRELKYIIYKRYNRIGRFKFPSSYSHYYFTRDNGIDYYNDVIETGLIVEGKIIIVECKDIKHLHKRQELTLFSERSIKARIIESRYLYKLTELREGD